MGKLQYTFNRRQFLLKNGALHRYCPDFYYAEYHYAGYQACTAVYIYQCPEYSAAGVSAYVPCSLSAFAGLILLTGTDLSIGRMVGMGMVTATIIMHQGNQYWRRLQPYL